jgi:hypothetical protein
MADTKIDFEGLILKHMFGDIAWEILHPHVMNMAEAKKLLSTKSIAEQRKIVLTAKMMEAGFAGSHDILEAAYKEINSH